MKVRFNRWYNAVLTALLSMLEIEYHQLLNEKILLLEDVDGAANGGEFQSDTIDISKLEPKKIGEGDGRWYEGKFEIQADVKMKRK